MTCSGLDQVRRGGRNSDTMHNTRVFLNRVCLQAASLLVFASASLSSRLHPLSSRPLHSLSSRLHPLSRRSTLSLLAFSCRWSPSRTLQFSFTLYQVHCPHNEPSSHSCCRCVDVHLIASQHTLNQLRLQSDDAPNARTDESAI